MLPTARVISSATCGVEPVDRRSPRQQISHLHRAIGKPRGDARMADVLIDRH